MGLEPESSGRGASALHLSSPKARTVSAPTQTPCPTPLHPPPWLCHHDLNDARTSKVSLQSHWSQPAQNGLSCFPQANNILFLSSSHCSQEKRSVQGPRALTKPAPCRTCKGHSCPLTSLAFSEHSLLFPRAGHCPSSCVHFLFPACSTSSCDPT